LHEGCKIRASFNKEGEKKPLYCLKHKLDGMTSTITKCCIYKDCKISAAFNKEGEKSPLYCSIHKLDGMINLRSNFCICKDCIKTAVFNIKGETKGLYCAEHKLEGMINIKSKNCLYEGCKLRPTFNKEGDKIPLYCAKHKLDGMIGIFIRRCIYEGCKTSAYFNIEGNKIPLYCSQHKSQDMINIVAKRCKTNLCYTLVTKKYDGYCLYCYIHLFPDTPLSRNYKTKESAVTTFIKKNNPDYDFQIDKKIIDGCSKRRPDLLLDLGYQIIIIEIDENKHANYDCTCENKRIMEISQDLAHRPIVFIRFNPDSYEDHESEISSCWHVNTKGFCVVKKSKQKEWEQRLNTLDETLKYWINPTNKTSKMVEIIELFY
jgi:hypothetical protein